MSRGSASGRDRACEWDRESAVDDINCLCFSGVYGATMKARFRAVMWRISVTV